MIIMRFWGGSVLLSSERVSDCIKPVVVKVRGKRICGVCLCWGTLLPTDLEGVCDLSKGVSSRSDCCRRFRSVLESF